MVVTIDGVAGAGKSTVARMVAKQLGFKFLSTGMLYRAAAYHFDKLGLKVINEKAIKKLLANFKLNVDFVFFMYEENLSLLQNKKDRGVMDRIVPCSPSSYIGVLTCSVDSECGCI